jgi:hypothetical protein
MFCSSNTLLLSFHGKRPREAVNLDGLGLLAASLAGELLAAGNGLPLGFDHFGAFCKSVVHLRFSSCEGKQKALK